MNYTEWLFKLTYVKCAGVLISCVCVCVCPQNWHEVVNKANDHMTHSMVSVKVTSDISALCNASNDMGTEVKVFSIKASKSLTHTLWNICMSVNAGCEIVI